MHCLFDDWSEVWFVHLKTAIFLFYSVLPLQWVLQLSFIHGRDTTGYPFFTGMKGWLKAATRLINCTDFADDGSPIEITVDVYDQATQFLANTHSNKSDNFPDCDIATLNTFNNITFLDNINKSTLPKLLPPTEKNFRTAHTSCSQVCSIYKLTIATIMIRTISSLQEGL